MATGANRPNLPRRLGPQSMQEALREIAVARNLYAQAMALYIPDTTVLSNFARIGRGDVG